MFKARHVVPFITGLVASMGVHLVTGWWLNSGAGVAVMLLVLAAVSAAVARLLGGPVLALATSIWCGSFLGMIVTLLQTGAGRIWPIVLVVSAMFSAGAVAAGAFAGRALGSSRKTRE